LNSNFKNISIPAFVRDGLSEIASIEGRSMSEVVTEWVLTRLNEIKGGGVDELNGFRVIAETANSESVVAFCAIGAPIAQLSIAEASMVADALQATEKRPLVINGTQHGNRLVKIAQRGRGISIEVDGRLASLPSGLAELLAKIVRVQITKAESAIRPTEIPHVATSQESVHPRPMTMLERAKAMKALRSKSADKETGQ
jgi:hypothetical protein